MTIENDDLMLIDFYKNEYDYKNVTLFFGKHENTKYWGDDWNDRSYEHNAGEVYREYVDKTELITLNNAIILQPCDTPEPNSGWCKQDFKKRLTPCLLIVPQKVLEEDYECYNPCYDEYPTYNQAVGNPRVQRIYYEDSYPQVIHNINYYEVPRNEEKPKEPQEEEIKRGINTTAYSLQKWINHLNEEEKHLPIFIYDDQKRYHDIKSVVHELLGAREDAPPSNHFLMITKRFKTTEEVKSELQLEYVITGLCKVLNYLEPKGEGCDATEHDMYHDMYCTLNDCINRLETIQRGYKGSDDDCQSINE